MTVSQLSLFSDNDSAGTDLWEYEKQARSGGYCTIAGIDEAGRGPLAGPVVAAAVVLPVVLVPAGITDSKKLTPNKRRRLYDRIYAGAVAVGIGIVDPPHIDQLNILRASLLAMAISVENLSPRPDFLLVDGKFTIPSSLPQAAVVRGDSMSISIAAASIIAKETRDRLMERYHLDYPEFGFSRHKGYPTRAHREAIRQFGCCPIHRRSFKGVKDVRIQDTGCGK
jgi:ribonuclease HII